MPHVHQWHPSVRLQGESSVFEFFIVSPFPASSDIVKCQLKPLTPSDYSVAFTPAQWEWLQAIFPSGVCDWSKPGIEQQDLLGTWVFFE